MLLNDNVNYWVTQCRWEITEHQWSDNDNEKLKYMGKNQSHYHYGHHCPGIKLRPFQPSLQKLDSMNLAWIDTVSQLTQGLNSISYISLFNSLAWLHFLSIQKQILYSLNLSIYKINSYKMSVTFSKNITMTEQLGDNYPWD